MHFIIPVDPEYKNIAAYNLAFYSKIIEIINIVIKVSL
jgi:hypothetical protein